MREIEIRILKNQIRLAKYLPHEKYQVKIKTGFPLKANILIRLTIYLSHLEKKNLIKIIEL